MVFLRKVTLRYCNYGGSSRGMRQYISEELKMFAQANPDVEVRCELGRNQHPTLRGHYDRGVEKVIDVKNNIPKDIEKVVQYLRSSSGRKVTGFDKPVYSKLPSLQGLALARFAATANQFVYDKKYSKR
ncbi:thioredoxin-like protein [Pelagophyceae sp. CCMP2097]|nr:thioredoxin-like protein [Pelagophyceae sp. CCMP2097]|mmetsp:Transcript_4027/g.12431  ORF Transcript_4027/g.12431 Transcript_4027/m.12431 type:complete len:129 (+) Transcript_4027:64-450(+)